MTDTKTIGQMINITHHALCRSWRNYKDDGDETNARQAYARAQGYGQRGDCEAGRVEEVTDEGPGATL